MRNTGLTLASIGIPLFAAFLVMPGLTRHLGSARFGLLGRAGAIRPPRSALTFLIPAIASPFGVRLPGILLGMLIARLMTCVALVIGVHRALPGVAWSLPAQWRLPRALVSFGGWIAVSNVV